MVAPAACMNANKLRYTPRVHVPCCALQNLSSRLTAGTTGTSQRLGAFGSLLGDKAAEVTAMASQSLGDYVPTAFPSGLASSSLSGFTSGASGLFAGFKGLRGSSG